MNAVAQLDTTHLVALAAALGWASGLRLYAVVFLTGLAGWLGWLPLPPGLQILQHPLVLGASGLMLVIEFLADKIPAVDSLWDALHTVIRIPAGAALAAGVFSGMGGEWLGGDATVWATIAALLGGTLAATSHVAKATTRAAINTSPEPFSNIGASLLGDAAVPAMLWLAWTHPLWFFVCLAVALVLMGVLIVVLMKFLRGLIRMLRARFSGGAAMV
ncbi:DUF4126 domain-containing protein [Aquabacterium sp.]|uniref:DUF4126 domain-containing protein n=1 Tax=Aquabacterium sp. TaxID=1872578 RepID=UPI002B85A2C6|nr:DUF4126 domain-containing protein [Aquabacterium sp.]HSW05455.1 DUF4126 domain-containing protein [Aquabacterium sp.]